MVDQTTEAACLKYAGLPSGYVGGVVRYWVDAKGVN